MPDFRHSRHFLAVVIVAFLAACASNDGRTMKPPTAGQSDTIAIATTAGESLSNGSTMTLNGPWTNGSAIDARYTCDGDGLSPALSWTPGPDDTQAYALTIVNMDDEANIPWVVTNIDFAVTTSPEGSIASGGVVAKNATGAPAYDPPCPPVGSTHTFVVSVYALDALTPLDDDPDARTIITDIEAAAIQAATTVFTVTR